MAFKDKYEVSELLGKGSFGEVKKCIDTLNHEVFAVKIVGFTSDDERRKALQEAKVSASVGPFRTI